MPKVTYLDTGCLLDAWKVKDCPAFDLLNDPDRVFVSSTVARLELIPLAAFHKSAPEVAFYEDFFKSIRRWRKLDEGLLVEALKLGSAHGLTAFDSLHLAAAADLKADEFITTEKPGKSRLYRIGAPKVVYLYA